MKKILIFLMFLGLIAALQNTAFSEEPVINDSSQALNKEARDKFFKKAQDYFKELTWNNDYETAKAKFKEFLDSEGSKFLDSYKIYDGANVELHFKGEPSATGWTGPFISFEQQDLFSSEIFSVSEILKMLETNPGQFKGKDVLISGVFVTATRCIGCCGYQMWADQQDADLYFRLWDEMAGLGSKEEKQQQSLRIENIPMLRIKSGAAASKIKVDKKSHVLRGHFFDSGMRACQGQCCDDRCDDFWKYFVATEEVGGL